MSMDSISFIVIILGVVIAIALFIKNRQLSRSLTGSFFKKSYSYATLGSAFLALSFAMEALPWVGFDEVLMDTIHHVLMLLSSISFFWVAVEFPKEVDAALSGKK